MLDSDATGHRALGQGFGGKGRNGNGNVLHIFGALLRGHDDVRDAATITTGSVLRVSRRRKHGE
jgi:hypothetical protein